MEIFVSSGRFVGFPAGKGCRCEFQPLRNALGIAVVSEGFKSQFNPAQILTLLCLRDSQIAHPRALLEFCLPWRAHLLSQAVGLHFGTRKPLEF